MPDPNAEGNPLNGPADDVAPEGKPSEDFKGKKWLLMLFMKVDAPNLEGPLDLDLEELRRPLAAARYEDRRKVRVVLQIDYPSGISKRYQLKANRAIPIDGGSGKTSDSRFELCEFVEWARCTYDPNNKMHTALVIWGHAVGIGESLEAPRPTPAGAPREGGIPQAFGLLANALGGSDLVTMLEALWTTWMVTQGVGNTIQSLAKLKRPLDIVGFDACYMAMVEIAYELHCATKYILAPQASIGLEGWHYDLLLDHILHNPDVTSGGVDDVLNLGKAAVQQVGLREASPQSLTLLCTEKSKTVVILLKRLFLEIAHQLAKPTAESGLRHQVLAAFNAAQWAGVRQFVDLVDLCRQLAGRIAVPQIRRRATDVLAALTQTRQVAGAEHPLVERELDEHTRLEPDGLVVDQLSTVGLPLGGVSLYSPWPRATESEVAQGVRNVEIDIFSYLWLRFVQDTLYYTLFLHPNNFVAAERRWIRREVLDGMGTVAQELYRVVGAGGRDPENKPASRDPENKPAGREPGNKPAGRGEDSERIKLE